MTALLCEISSVTRQFRFVWNNNPITSLHLHTTYHIQSVVVSPAGVYGMWLWFWTAMKAMWQKGCRAPQTGGTNSNYSMLRSVVSSPTRRKHNMRKWAHKPPSPIATTQQASHFTVGFVMKCILMLRSRFGWMLFGWGTRLLSRYRA